MMVIGVMGVVNGVGDGVSEDGGGGSGDSQARGERINWENNGGEELS